MLIAAGIETDELEVEYVGVCRIVKPCCRTLGASTTPGLGTCDELDCSKRSNCHVRSLRIPDRDLVRAGPDR